MGNLVLIRHGETPWSLTGRHTGKTDLLLTENGKNQATAVGKRLKPFSFEAVFTSPLKRALETCELAGYGKRAQVLSDLVEWDYGAYEGLTTEEIHKQVPGWNVFTHGAPGGESLHEIDVRTSRVLEKIKTISGDILIFSSGHFLRAFTAKWLTLSVSEGRLFVLSPASFSILGKENQVPAILCLNDTAHIHGC